jgi:hypothetical protein
MLVNSCASKRRDHVTMLDVQTKQLTKRYDDMEQATNEMLLRYATIYQEKLCGCGFPKAYSFTLRGQREIWAF